MATTSVTEYHTIPGIHDLTINLRDRPNDPERVAKAASNVHLPIARGIVAIGVLLAAASERDPDIGPIPKDALYDLGYLLQELGNLAEAIEGLGEGAQFWMKEDLKARDVVKVA